MVRQMEQPNTHQEGQLDLTTFSHQKSYVSYIIICVTLVTMKTNMGY